MGKSSYQDGAIIHQDTFISPTLYDISNNLLTAQFDGRGNISKYSVVNKWEFISSFSTILQFGDHIIDYTVPKTVLMIGRKQVVTLNTPYGDIRITSFADSTTNAIFQQYEITPAADTTFSHTFNIELDGAAYLKALFIDRFSLSNLGKAIFGTVGKLIKDTRKGYVANGCFVSRCDPLGECYIDIAMPPSGKQLERNRMYVNQYTSSITAPKGSTSILRLVYSMGTRGDFSECDVQSCYHNFDAHLQKCNDYISAIPMPKACDSGLLQSLFTSCYNCSLSMYKEKGQFKGFLAGIVYQSPARTYFRDGYWTALSVLPYQPELIKNQIITLSKGINKDGKCPSAVRYNFKNWWGNHYDSPSFFAILLYDYVRITGDTSILDYKWRGKKTILDAAIMVIQKLSQYADDTGLLYKAGPYNRRDWCDNVFREGYVTYDEALYARALYSLAGLTQPRNKTLSKSYYAQYQKVKQAINSILWAPDLGYFVNYKDKTTTEDNLSIDTVIMVLFGLTTDQRAQSMLQKMEQLLESKNNQSQKAGDFGVLSVYPFYKYPQAVVAKSSLPYYYHNGGDWPYWSALYAYAKRLYGMDYMYPLTRWFEYNISQNNFTPIEFFSPLHKDGSLLQGWSGAAAFVLSWHEEDFFTKNIK